METDALPTELYPCEEKTFYLRTFNSYASSSATLVGLPDQIGTLRTKTTTGNVIKDMSQAELRSYTVQIRAKLDDGTYTPEDAYRTLWNRDTPLSYEQRLLIHQTLELPFEAPTELDILLIEPATAELI